MHTHPHQKRRRARMLLCTALLMLSSQTVLAAETQAELTFAPHCILPVNSCPQFSALDPQTLETPMLKVGDILDIDVLVRSADASDITTVRSWLEYDTSVLEARTVEINDTLPERIPGEESIDATLGLIKIGGSAKGSWKDQENRIARVTFRVLTTQKNSFIRFHNFSADGKGESAVLNADKTQMLATQPTTLLVRVNALSAQDPYKSSTNSSTRIPTTAQTTSSTSSFPANTAGSAFPLLQVQNVRVTTRETNLMVGWDAIPSKEVTGYNVYYGMVSGKYVQRRSVPVTARSLIIRDAEAGSQYFVAVRAFNAQNQETAFSDEVAVVIGKPETSTSPLGATATPPVDENPIETRGGTVVTGETGISSMILLIIVGSAVIGTGFAFRKHLA